MEKRTKKILLISSSLLLIGGGIFWLWWRNRPKKEETSTEGTTNETTGSSGNLGTTTTPTKPSNVLSFQKFANSKGYTPKLVEDGIWGSKTSAAWNVWGTEYEKGVTPIVLKKGDRMMPKIPLVNAVAYSTQTGKALGRVKSAVFEKSLSNSPNWFLAKAMIPTGALNIPTSTTVQLQTKEWIKA